MSGSFEGGPPQASSEAVVGLPQVIPGALAIETKPTNGFSNEHSHGVGMEQADRRDRKVVAAVNALTRSTGSHPSSGAGIHVKWSLLEYAFEKKQKKMWWKKADEEEGYMQHKVLMNVSGEVRPGQFLAVMGPEGSGKSLFLRILAGRLHSQKHLRGTVTYNGKPYSNYVRSETGYLEHVVHLQENLTVKETLVYAAKLKLPEETEEIDRIVRVEHILDSLELTQCADTLVGRVGGVLNNERRRLAIGLAMITNPSILLLDEPTSGLDGAMALRITRLLAAYADGGRTVIASMEQPSGRMFELFSLLQVLAEGNPIYFGPANAALAYFEGLGHKASYNCSPGEYLMDLAVAEPSDASIHYGTTMNLVRNWRERQGLHPSGVVDPNLRAAEELANSGGGEQDHSRWITSWGYQFRVLLQRNIHAYNRTLLDFVWPLIIIVLFSVLVGCLWYQRTNNEEGVRDLAGFLFFVQLFWGLLPMLSSLITFLQDRTLIRQDQESGIYHISAYFASRSLQYLPYEILPPVVFSCITFWMVDVSDSFGRFVLFTLTLVLDCILASSIGLAVGALSHSSKQALWVATIIQLLSLVVVDFLVLNAPGWVAWTKYLSFSTYIHRLLLRASFPHNGTYECQVIQLGSPGGLPTTMTQRCLLRDNLDLRKHLDAIPGGGAVEAVVLLCMLVGFRFLALWFLKERTKLIGMGSRDHKVREKSFGSIRFGFSR